MQVKIDALPTSISPPFYRISQTCSLFFSRRSSLFPQTIPTWEWNFSFPRLFTKQSYDLGKFYPRCSYQVVTTSQNRQQEAETGYEAGGGPWGTRPGRSGHRVRSWCWQELWVNSELWILGCFNPQVLNPGWWFGTWLLFFHILGMIIPIDVHIFQRGWNHQPESVWWLTYVNIMPNSFLLGKSWCVSLQGWGWSSKNSFYGGSNISHQSHLISPWHMGECLNGVGLQILLGDNSFGLFGAEHIWTFFVITISQKKEEQWLRVSAKSR